MPQRGSGDRLVGAGRAQQPLATLPARDRVSKHDRLVLLLIVSLPCPGYDCTARLKPALPRQHEHGR